MKRRSKIALMLGVAALLYAVFFVWYFDIWAPLGYSKTVENDEEILLSGRDVLVIKDAFYRILLKKATGFNHVDGLRSATFM